MKKSMIIALVAVLFSMNGLYAQKYFTREAKVDFVSDSPLEKIEAKNSNAACVLDTETGKIQFSTLIKAFQFEKALMQEHFNENYMESTKFPKGIFKGKIDNLSDVDFGKDGKYEVTVSGQMTIHGVTKDLKSTGTITVSDQRMTAKSTFVVAVADYDIKVPALVRDNIAKEVQITVNARLKPFSK